MHLKSWIRSKGPCKGCDTYVYIIHTYMHTDLYLYTRTQTRTQIIYAQIHVANNRQTIPENLGDEAEALVRDAIAAIEDLIEALSLDKRRLVLILFYMLYVLNRRLDRGAESR